MSHVFDRSFEQELKESFLEYARTTITDRALPDARDGLKPVHRRVLYAMYELGLAPNKPYKKSARIVGDVIGKYHPHGDSSVYLALVRLAQHFSTRYPLVDGHGNFGSIDGDPPAAMRYTEARMSEIAMLLLEDIEHTVDFQPNFDDSLKEPLLLPSKLPNLLLNGTTGIAVGMSTTMVPHHGKEVIKALIALLEDEKVDITKYIKGPDFPTGGVIINPKDWKKTALTGKGTIKIRATHSIEEVKDKKQIVFTDVPYSVNKTKILEKIAELYEKIQGIADIREESGRQGIRIVVEVKKDVDENYILHELFAKTPLETNISVQNQVLINGKPEVVGIKELLRVFTQHRLEILEKKYTHALQVEQDRFHLLEGQVIALKNTDAVLDAIKRSRTKETAKKKLQEQFGLSEKQADTILGMRFQRLTGTDKKDLEEKMKTSQQEIKRLNTLLSDLLSALKAEWEGLLPLFKEPRQTKMKEQEEISFEVPSSTEEVVVVVSEKEISRQSLRAGEKEGIMIKATTDETVYVVSEHGLSYPFKVKDLPDTTGGKGKVQVLPERTIWAGLSTEEPTFLVVTKNGKGKQVKLEPGRRVLPISKEVDFVLHTEEKELLVLTKNGVAIRFEVEELPLQGKAAGGVKIIHLQEDDEVFAVLPVKEETEITMKATTGSRTATAGEVSLTKRGGKGIKTFTPTYPKGGTLKEVLSNELGEPCK